MIVDTHCHIVVPEMLTAAAPPDWRPAIGREDGRPVVHFRGRRLTSVTGEFCDVGVMLAQAARAGVDHLLLSPWIMLCPVDADLAEALALCRLQNESLAAASAAHAGVSALGVVPLQDGAVAARELTELMTVPGIRGAEVPASVAGVYLGDERFWPFWAAAADTGALIFVHPTTRGLGLPALDGHYLWNSVGNPLETAITAAHLVTAGVLERFAGLRILLAHGGGALHAVRGRLRRAHAVRPEAAADAPAGPDASLRRFYYDSLTHDPALLADLVGYAGAGHVLLGSDRPFDMGTDDPVGEVRALGLGDAERLILGENARALLGITPPA